MATGVRKLDAIVLAAGAGRRFGGSKLSTDLGGGPLLDGALAAAFAAPVRTVTVVWGADGRVLEVASRWASRNRQVERLRLVHAADHAEGMAASLRAGVAALPPRSAGVFVFLGDMPRVPHDLAARLAQTLDTAAWAAAPQCGGVRGHPVLFTAKLYPTLASQTGDRGAGRLLAALGDDLALVETRDDGVLFDVDERP
ncbi:nucleotidyltransferase family protein [Caulobacter mirabilis]|uniref:Molybdopterin-guanine dinucleotide biosynthesis protein MobA n=1 Tax=Caulobacter mirabilis TaxID=69666 RepID=A0A2D2ASW7_9CAUL|nr:nucleotidyltransferase family protein [Caulobacter mirabilis]ATQ41099.1 molybdopterin-guanine dinucleotide biosynthesis protein MobA [Caulobacter mirabilis]